MGRGGRWEGEGRSGMQMRSARKSAVVVEVCGRWQVGGERGGVRYEGRVRWARVGGGRGGMGWR